MLSSILLLVISVTLAYSNPLQLRGYYVKSEPFIFNDATSGQLQGYSIDIINEIARKVGFKYELYETPDGTYGRQRENGSWSDLIGEVEGQKADFAITDITVTEQRAKVIDFTEPIMNITLAAIISKSHREGINSFKDLASQTKVKYGLIRSGSTMAFFKSSSHPTIKRMYSYMNNNPDTLVNSITQGSARVKTEPYAFIGESSSLQYLADKNCDMRLISGQEYGQRQYAIVLQKGSTYLHAFNKAMIEMRDSGELDTLQTKYWNKKCYSSKVNEMTWFQFLMQIIF